MVAMLIVVMTVQTFIFGFGGTQIQSALLVGVLKAFAWFFALQTVRNLHISQDSCQLLIKSPISETNYLVVHCTCGTDLRSNCVY